MTPITKEQYKAIANHDGPFMSFSDANGYTCRFERVDVGVVLFVISEWSNGEFVSAQQGDLMNEAKNIFENRLKTMLDKVSQD